jgi:Na+/melibiose symporter-like transporter
MVQAATHNSAPTGQVNEHTRWNFAVINTEAAAFQLGLAWADPVAVLPLFIAHLTPSTVLIGLVTVFQRLGYILPQLPMAAILGHRPRRLPYLRWGVFFGRLPFLAFVAYLWLRGVSDSAVVLVFMMFSYFSVAAGNGVVAVPWQDIIAKSIPSFLRGRFFATMQFATAVGSLGVSFVVRWMLGPQGPAFPRNYTILFTLVAAFISISTLGCAIAREPIRPVLDRPQSLRHILASARPLLRLRSEFRGLVLISLLATGMSWTTPFYIVYATRQLHVPQETAGIYIGAAVIGGAVFSLIWGRLNDRRGPLAVIRGGCAFVMTTPLLAIGIPALLDLFGRLHPGLSSAVPYAYALVFVTGGATFGALWMGSMNYLFAMADHPDRPRYIALLSFLSLPGALILLLIGWLLGFLPFPLVFAFISVCGLAATLLARRMPEAPSLDSPSIAP